VAHNIETIAELESLTPEQRALRFDPSELNSLQDELSSMKAKLQVHNTVKVRAKEIKARLDELESAWQKEKALELLIEAYSDKNVKRMIVAAISQHLMASVNQYASLVFKDYSFEFVWGTQIQIIVNRPEGATDVRKLSGAESKLFTLILVLSLLKFVPRSKRLSLLVLDEPTASFSEETTEMFHTLLPHLQQIIPSILIITPDSRERLEGANEYTVVRERKGSKIVRGHPESIR
jgi:DNA repair exonuclease SbcCD ATPase subunit